MYPELLGESFNFFDRLAELIQQVIEILGVILVVAGGLFCFAGYRLFKILLVLTGALIGAVIGGVLTLGNPIGAVFGAMIGALIFFILYFLGIFMSGVLLGIIAVFLFSLFAPMPGAMYLIAALAGGILAIAYEKLIMIISTSFTGALYLVLGGTLLFLRPDVAMIIPTLKMMPMWIIIVALAGITVQYDFFRNKGLQRSRPVRSPSSPNYVYTGDRSDPAPPQPEPVNPYVRPAQSRSNVAPGNAGFNPTETGTYNLTRRPSQQRYSGNALPGTSQDTMLFQQPDNEFPVKLRQTNGSNAGTTYPLRGRWVDNHLVAVVGRPVPGQHLDVAVNEKVISRQHLKLVLKDKNIYAMPISTTNKTFVNNNRLHPNQFAKLRKGDRLEMAGIIFEILPT
ncbi:MAG: FHA domain-containing protein [Prolixibacteraceae bacterium]